MSKVRVYEVAKQLNMDQKALVALFQSMGVGDVRNHMSAVESEVVERLKRHLERQKAPQGVEERMRSDGRVVKRRARPVEGGPESAPQARPSSPGVPPDPPSRSGFDARPMERPSEPGLARPPIPPPPPSAPAARPSEPRARREDDAPAEPIRRAAPSSPGHDVPPPAPSRPRAPAIDEIVVPPPRASEPKRAAKHEELEAPPVEVAPQPPIEVAPAAPPPPPPAPIEAAPLPPPPPLPTPAPPARPAPAAEVKPADKPAEDAAPKRPSTPPKTGIEVWDGWAGRPQGTAGRTGTTPTARRTIMDTRSSPQGRPGPSFGPGGRQQPGGMRGGQRPGQFNRKGPGGMSAGPRRPPNISTQEMSSHKKVVKMEEQISLQQLAGKMSLKSTDVLMRLISMGMTGVNINSTLDAETAKILASEFGWSVEDVAVSETDAISAAMGSAEVETDQEVRPPIVTVMGHVDHGKTSLLDRIRKATVAEGEAGGITQHVGAYRVETPRGTVAFLDTPGHEAFTAMRARGASVTDIVVLVVAADDGVMPQTKEAINHAQAAKVPIIVAVNKIDKPGSDPDKIKRDLAALGLQPEEWGGETIFAHVSAKTGEGIEQLLESILLQAEVLELKASPKKRASGTVIEALLDRGRGPVARVMVQDGTLRVGDVLLAGGAWGKVRAMTDEIGRAVAEAGPATPVEVLGLNEVPSAGDPVHAVKDAKQAEEIAETRRKKLKSLIPPEQRISLEQLTTRLAEADQLELKLIIKGDVQGSVEAVGHALSKLSTQKVKVTIVNAAVGGITEGDVNLAVASKAIIVGFNVRPAGKAAAHAEAEGVEIRLYNIIYNAVDDIRSAMEGLLPATKIERILGKAEVRQVFRITKVGAVAGSMVLSGVMRRTADARLLRDSIVVWTGKLSGLRRFKDDVREVAEGFECGISLENYSDIKEGDVVESFEIEEIKTKLS